MDVVLEVADTYLLDRVYATLLPANPSQYISYKFSNASSTTFPGAAGKPQYNYIYEPASQFISLEPTPWTYSSSWPRDNIIRQGISLFAIVWYGITNMTRSYTESRFCFLHES
jgi:lathosterol oxidase